MTATNDCESDPDDIFDDSSPYDVSPIEVAEGLISEAVDLLRGGDVAGARERLEEVAWYGAPDLLDAIRDEAESLLAAGMVEEAARRLEAWARPKFKSEADCRQRYAEAMRARYPEPAPEPAPTLTPVELL